jgi:hypothetical protein
MEEKQHIVWIADTEINRRGISIRKPVKYVLYGYTFTHSDLIEGGDCYVCSLCRKEYATKFGVVKHISSAHHMESEDEYGKRRFRCNRRSKIKKIDISLDKFRLWCASRGRVVEILVDSEEDAYELAKCRSIRELLKKVDTSKMGLVGVMEDFEDRVREVYDRYLGTPKEKVELIER